MPKIRVLQKPIDPNARLKIHDWATHLPILVKVLDRWQPSTILELGGGDFSTVCLHEYAEGRAGFALTAENNQEWLDNLSWMASAWHDFVFCPTWDYRKYFSGPWGLVLIDHAPEHERQPALEFFAKCDGVVVLHDSQYPERYGKYYPLYKYILHDKRYVMNTSVFSNVVDVTEWFPDAVEEHGSGK